MEELDGLIRQSQDTRRIAWLLGQQPELPAEAMSAWISDTSLSLDARCLIALVSVLQGHRLPAVLTLAQQPLEFYQGILIGHAARLSGDAEWEKAARDYLPAGDDLVATKVLEGVRRLYGGDSSALEPAAPTVKVGRNDPCPCGRGQKFKKCCGR